MNDSLSSSQDSSKRGSVVASNKQVKPALRRTSKQSQGLSERKQSELPLNPESNSSQEEEELKQEAPKQQ